MPSVKCLKCGAEINYPACDKAPKCGCGGETKAETVIDPIYGVPQEPRIGRVEKFTKINNPKRFKGDEAEVKK
jgi:hypothetical protein